MRTHCLVVALAVLAALATAGCVPLLTPHAQARGTIGAAVGRTRTGAPLRARLSGTIDTVYVPTALAGCERELDLSAGARFHFVEPETADVTPERVGGVVSGTWFFVRGPYHRGELRIDLDALELDGRVLGGISLTVGAEFFGIAEGAGAAASWAGAFAGAWSGEAGIGVEATVAYHEDFGGVRYATFTAGFTVRWPAGAGVGIINPVLLAMIALNATGASPTTGAPSPSPTPPPTPPSGSVSSVASEPVVRGCGETRVSSAPEPYRPTGAVDDLDEEGAFRCMDRDGIQETVDAESVASAERACALMLGTPCTCERDRSAER